MPRSTEPVQNEPVLNETELIQNYLAPLAAGLPGAFNLQDDAALISVEAGYDLVITSDPIVAGVHFFAEDRPDDLAWKALAVNMSDLAAKGAKPTHYMLTLAFPTAPERAWMAAFARGLADAQAEFGCTLVGGDTDKTGGPLSIGVTAFGQVPKGRFVLRKGAEPGDHVFVTGTLGDAALGLAEHRTPGIFEAALTDGDRAFLLGRYLRPNPRLSLIDALRSYARAALDVSDGLLKDLNRLVGRHGMVLALDRVPLSPSTRLALASDPRVADAVLSGGDDYELLVAVPPERVAAFLAATAETGVNITDIGQVHESAGLSVVDQSGQPIEVRQYGYDHFAK